MWNVSRLLCCQGPPGVCHCSLRCACRYVAVMAPAAADAKRMLASCGSKALTQHETAFYEGHAGRLREIVAQLQRLDPSANVDVAAKSLAALQGALSLLTRLAP